jgi:hypothetical protein
MGHGAWVPGLARWRSLARDDEGEIAVVRSSLPVPRGHERIAGLNQPDLIPL